MVGDQALAAFPASAMTGENALSDSGLQGMAPTPGIALATWTV